MSFDTPAAPGRRWPIYLGAGLLIAAVAAGLTLLLTRGGDGADPQPSVPVANGVPRPDHTCVTADGGDRREYWDANGWWAGWVDGEVKQMPSNQALALRLSGHSVTNAWICAPR
jgi:hypothetical protein